ncbi:hypothetical protein PP_18 [Cyanophage PP]|uniref:Uncharacterized protein n=1 Tax=Cyanophage PP TaxID=434346 RepID=U5PRF8_9CAUD|nr:hypothetical protein V420_gp18 [Cyanophage PP]AGY46485.1 hypothetical protein PP_18 [Cyanophage PP]
MLTKNKQRTFNDDNQDTLQQAMEVAYGKAREGFDVSVKSDGDGGYHVTSYYRMRGDDD